MTFKIRALLCLSLLLSSSSGFALTRLNPNFELIPLENPPCELSVAASNYLDPNDNKDYEIRREKMTCYQVNPQNLDEISCVGNFDVGDVQVQGVAIFNERNLSLYSNIASRSLADSRSPLVSIPGEAPVTIKKTKFMKSRSIYKVQLPALHETAQVYIGCESDF